MIQLPDFEKCVEVRELLVRMGIQGLVAPLTDYDPKEFVRKVNVSKISIHDNSLQYQEYQKLLNSSIDIACNDFAVGNDGLLEINGIKICIYIKLQYADYMYKYHLCECEKIREMKSINRGKRYVATSRSDGLFPVIREGKEKKETLEELGLCGYCRNELMSHGMYSPDFTLDGFFAKYQPEIKAEYRSEHLVQDWEQYTPDWPEISAYYKKQQHYRCQLCGLDCNANRHLLHTHHKDRNKENNLGANLVVLCAYCHSRQPGHGHMLEDPETCQALQDIFLLQQEQGITRLD